METKISKLRMAVADGISKGWTAKETAYYHNCSIEDIRRTALKMKTAFNWTRLGIPPKYSNEPVPLTTLFKRHRHTAMSAARRIASVTRRMDKDSKETADLLKVIGFLRKRSFPEAWESRVRVTK